MTDTQSIVERLESASEFLTIIQGEVPPVEWGRTFKQSDGEHLSDFADTLRLTREHFSEMADETSIEGLYLVGTSVVLAHTGNSPNSPKHARMLAGLLGSIEAMAVNMRESAALITRQQEEIERLKALSSGWVLHDEPLPEDSQIDSAHPMNSGDHDGYMEAMRLVGAKRSKGALVNLVHWLLLRITKLQEFREPRLIGLTDDIAREIESHDDFECKDGTTYVRAARSIADRLVEKFGESA